MSIIVTGGAGLIGSAVIYELNRQNFSDIIVIDHLGVGDKYRNLVPLKYRDYFEKDTFMEKLLQGRFDSLNIEGIIHLGACSSTTEQDCSYLVENNFQYTKILAHWAVKQNIRFVYASSCATYGDGSNGYDDNGDITKLRPLNMYGYSKQMFDLYAESHGLLEHIAACKFSNVFGPNEYHKNEMRSVVMRAFEQISENGVMKLFKSYRAEYADGEQLRDFLYVKDAAKMVIYLFNHPEFNGIFNIGSGVASSWNNLVKAVLNAMNKEVKIQYIDMPETLRDKYQYYTLASIDKIRSCGYSEKLTSLEEAVADYVINYLSCRKNLEP